jgi:hypothetical protein
MKQKRDLTLWGLVLVAAFAFNAAASANAMAAPHFKASATGTLSGEGTGNQVFTTPAGTITCTEAAASGRVESLETPGLNVRVEYEGCTAFGFIGAEISPAEYNLHANGVVDVLKEIEINVASCHVIIPPQNGLTSVSYVNKAGGKIEEVLNVTGIHELGNGGICGGESTTGTITGNFDLELFGGTIEWV